MDDQLLLTMLQNAVQQIDDLRKVKTNADHEEAKGGTAITYKQYMTLLLSATMTYDAESGPKSRRNHRSDPHSNVFLVDSHSDGEEYEMSPYFKVDSNGDIFVSEWVDDYNEYEVNNVDQEGDYNLDTQLAYIINQQGQEKRNFQPTSSQNRGATCQNKLPTSWWHSPQNSVHPPPNLPRPQIPKDVWDQLIAETK